MPYHSIKCNRWWTEYWIFFEKQEEDLPVLPDEAEEHYAVKLIYMDKKLAWILGSFILTVISLVVMIIIYFTKDRIRLLVPSELRFSDYQWILGVTIFFFVGLFSLIICVILLHKSFFKPNKDQYLWKRFWIGLLLHSLKNIHKDFSNFDKKRPQITLFIEGFKKKYASLANDISTSFAKLSFNLEFVSWLENKLEALAQQPLSGSELQRY